MIQGKRPSRAAFQAALCTALLILLATPTHLRSQSNECKVALCSEGGGNAESQQDTTRSSEIGSVAAAWRASDGATSQTLRITEPPASPLPQDCSLTFVRLCGRTAAAENWFSASMMTPQSGAVPRGLTADGEKSGDGSGPRSVESRQNSKAAYLNDDVFYKNRLEFSLDGGWLPINIPFVFDVFLGDGYTMTDLKYTLVPMIASLRWQIDDAGGPWILRGNWDLEASAAVTLIPRGPETRYFAWIMGFRRNFVPRRGRIAPYFDGRAGLGDINAKEPLGILYAQGQDFTFTLNMGSGVRYNFNSRYSISAGLNWMHISNLYLSQPQFPNYGINVYGPMFGIDVRLGKPHRGSE